MKLIKIEDGLYINADKIVAIRGNVAEEEKCILFMDSQSPASAKFQVDRAAYELADDIEAECDDK